MRNLLIFIILSIFAFTARANSYYSYLLLQQENSYRELGTIGAQDIKYEHDFERDFGVGLKYRFMDDGKFFLGAGAEYQAPIKVKQNTTILDQGQDPSAFTSRDDLQHISFIHTYFNAHSRIDEKFTFLVGVQATMPDVRSHGRFDKYRIANGIGYRVGLEFSIYKKWKGQFHYREVVLDTEDANSYEGEIDISSIMAALGLEF